ncbi:MAG: hypothetical protein KDD49_10485 [Bacteroidetes bacterium]|nr:hypothetical protein [Bacteroidota bacterium]
MDILSEVYQPLAVVRDETVSSREAKVAQMWMSVDPLAEKYPNASPYNYVMNNPIVYIDIKGDSINLSEVISHFPPNLWFSEINHPDPQTGYDSFGDHCAINLSEAIIESGQELINYEGATCWNCQDKNGKHALRAEELAEWLVNHPLEVGTTPVQLTGENFEEYVQGKQGIIFFRDYWQRDGEKGRTGDYIDIWNKNELESIGMILTWMRRTFPNFSENFLDMSDLRKSTKVLFWELEK